jgi:prefoldin subunit 5
MAGKEQTLEEWVSDMTLAHNNHAKAIEILELRERELNDRLQKTEIDIDHLRRAINTLMEALDVVVTPDEEK